MSNRHLSIALIAVVVLMTLYSGAFRVPEWQQALVVQFGEIRGDPITRAGLHFKIPFIQDVRLFDKRILTWDGDEERIPTGDEKFIRVDTTARWRISNVRKFAETVINEAGAHARLDTILDGETRNVIARFPLVEAVRNTNAILEAIAERRKRAKEAEEQGEIIEDAEVIGDISRIQRGREALSRLIVETARQKLSPLGIELIDVQLRRVSYAQSVEAKVYDRMISERRRIAEKIRSYGKGEEAKINGKLNLDLKEIQSEAYRESETIKGRAEASAIGIYAAALNQEPSYYELLRTLEAYKKSLAGKGHMILSTDSEFLRYLQEQP